METIVGISSKFFNGILIDAVSLNKFLSEIITSASIIETPLLLTNASKSNAPLSLTLISPVLGLIDNADRTVEAVVELNE